MDPVVGSAADRRLRLGVVHSAASGLAGDAGRATADALADVLAAGRASVATATEDAPVDRADGVVAPRPGGGTGIWLSGGEWQGAELGDGTFRGGARTESTLSCVADGARSRGYGRSHEHRLRPFPGLMCLFPTPLEEAATEVPILLVAIDPSILISESKVPRL